MILQNGITGQMMQLCTYITTRSSVGVANIILHGLLATQDLATPLEHAWASSRLTSTKYQICLKAGCATVVE
jgi:hypothetical protein